MRGIIVEKENGQAIIMTKKGEFIKIKDALEFAVGDEYIQENNYFLKNKLFLNSINNGKFIPMVYNKKLATMAASIALVFGMSTVAYGYVSPSKYINIDINPSVELVANRFDKVIKVKALNEDGTKILYNLNLKNKNAIDAVKLVMEAANEEGYLTQESENEILITVASKNEDSAKNMEMKLSNAVNQQIVDENIGHTPVTTESVGVKAHEEAEKLGISPGKLNLIQKLQQVNSDINYEEYSNKSVQEIMKAVKQAKTEEKDATQDIKETKTTTAEEEKQSTPQNGNGNDKAKDNVIEKSKTENEIKKENTSKNNNKEEKLDNNGTKNEKNSKNEKESKSEQGSIGSGKKSNFFNKLFKN
jgi:hypothetical protein